MADEPFIPNQASNKDPAEGARETTASRDGNREESREDQIDRDLAAQRAKDRGAGISNRPLADEKREQESLPARLARQDDGNTNDQTQRSAGTRGRLAGPASPDPNAVVEQPVMGVAAPEPNMPDEAGDADD